MNITGIINKTAVSANGVHVSFSTISDVRINSAYDKLSTVNITRLSTIEAI